MGYLVSCGAVAILTILATSLPASTQSGLLVTPLGMADLSPSQSRILSAVRNLPTTAEVQIVRLNVDSLMANSKIIFPTGSNTTVEILANTRQTLGPQRFLWTGQVDALPPGTTTMAVEGNAVTASIQTVSSFYRIQPLGNGAHALVKLDVTKFPPDHHPAFNERNRRPRDLPPFVKKPAGDLSITDLTVLVAYTPAVGSELASITGLVQQAFTESNDSYANSGVRIRLVPATAQPVPVNYIESGSHDADLSAFMNSHDGKMDEIHKVRNEQRADIAILLINDGSYCGTSTQVLASKESAFSVVHYNCATGPIFSFIHEIGHLQGALHNPEVDNAVVPFPYGHGYMDEKRNRRTIMSYDCPISCPRMPQWARPTEWGTADISNDARVLNETANYIASFR